MTKHFRLVHIGALFAVIGALAWFGRADAETEIKRSAISGEVLFRFETRNDILYRIETSFDLDEWRPVRTMRGIGTTFEHTEMPGPEVTNQYFRAVTIAAGSALTGDFLATDAGDVLIHPIDHASFVMQWDGKTIYNDPVGGSAAYNGIPPADLILVGHRHGDHFSSITIGAIRDAETQIIAPQDVFDRMSSTLQGLTTVLANGASTSVLGLDVEAVPAYNTNHPQGRDNGYVVTIGGKRIYMSGDTEDIAEMRALENIDVAFVSMNIPFTMSIDAAASATRDFQPKVIYPYHYRNQNGSFADLMRFEQLVGDDVGVRVRMRDWY